jgi:hypothetical protein
MPLGIINGNVVPGTGVEPEDMIDGVVEPPGIIPRALNSAIRFSGAAGCGVLLC